MTHTPYQWKGNLYCEGDIVFALTDHEPWSKWLDTHEANTRSAEAELTSIAIMFGFSRNDPVAVGQHGFPVRLKEPPEPPSFCSGCAQWFT